VIGELPLLLIHIGYHKTGTTFLQRRIFSNADVFHLVPWQEVESLLIEPTPYSFDAEVLNRNVASMLRPDRVNVFSHEELSGNIHSSGNGRSITWEVAERVARITVARVRVLMMVREQGSMVDSCYKQFIKEGGTSSVASYLGGPGRRRGRFPPFSIEHLWYDDVLAHYQRLLGESAVRVHLYEQFRRENGAILADLFEWLGINRAVDRVIARTVRRHAVFNNPSYTVVTLPLARLLNWLFCADAMNLGLFPARRLHRWGKGALYALDHYFTRHTRLYRRRAVDREVLEAMRDACATSNARLQVRLGVDLSRMGYRLPDKRDGDGDGC